MLAYAVVPMLAEPGSGGSLGRLCGFAALELRTGADRGAKVAHDGFARRIATR